MLVDKEYLITKEHLDEAMVDHNKKGKYVDFCYVREEISRETTMLKQFYSMHGLKEKLGKQRESMW